MRLIDADALKAVFEEKSSEAVCGVELCKAIIFRINKEPTVDAVPVIRCKNCIWFSIDQLKADGTPDRRCKPTWCALHKTYTEADFFCSWGNAE